MHRIDTGHFKRYIAVAAISLSGYVLALYFFLVQDMNMPPTMISLCAGVGCSMALLWMIDAPRTRKYLSRRATMKILKKRIAMQESIKRDLGCNDAGTDLYTAARMRAMRSLLRKLEGNEPRP